MRTWGRVYPNNSNVDENPSGWVEITTDAQGNNDQVWLTTLIQCLLLNLGESPFFANYGIPAQQSILTQVFPDYYVYITQQQFAQFFASLLINKVPARQPVYDVKIVTHTGVPISSFVPVPL